jgi:hypothetical protein
MDDVMRILRKSSPVSGGQSGIIRAVWSGALKWQFIQRGHDERRFRRGATSASVTVGESKFYGLQIFTFLPESLF